MSKGTGTISWGKAFAISSVFFGFHVGGGFASGSQTMNFFTKFGWTAAFMPLIAVIIQNLVFYNGFNNAQMNNSRHYREWTDAAYYPAQKFFSNFYEFANIILIILTISACTAGAGELLETNYGIPNGVGIALTSVIFVLLAIFGKAVVEKASTIMTVIIVGGLIIICGIGLTAPGANLGEMIKPVDQPAGGFGAALWSMLQYAGYQTYCVATLCPYASSMENKAGIRKTLGINVLLNGGIITLCSLVMLAWLPSLMASGSNLPFLTIIAETGHGWLNVLYTLVLMCAFISTAVGCVFGMITRYEEKVFKSIQINVRRTLIAVIAIAVSFFVSFIGLKAIVSKGYAYMGILGIFLMIIPTLTLVAYRNIKGIKTRNTESSAAAETK